MRPFADGGRAVWSFSYLVTAYGYCGDTVTAGNMQAFHLLGPFLVGCAVCYLAWALFRKSPVDSHQHEFELVMDEEKGIPKCVWVYDDIGVRLYRAQGCALRICKTCTRHEVCPLRGDHPDGSWLPVEGIQETTVPGPPTSEAQFENGATLQVIPTLAEGHYRVKGFLD